MRKKLPTIIIAIFLCIFILQMASIIFLLLIPEESQAITYTPQVKIPDGPEGTITKNSIGEYIQAIYNYAIGAVGILATAVMMLGGIVWITAGGNQTRIGEAKAWIGASLTGLVLVLASYTILNMINPDLLNFKGIDPKKPEIQKTDSNSGCCRISNNCSDTTRAECTGDFSVGSSCLNNQCIGSVWGCCTEPLNYGSACIDTRESLCSGGFHPGENCNNIVSCIVNNRCLSLNYISCSTLTINNGYCFNGNCHQCLSDGDTCSGGTNNYECCASTHNDCNGDFYGNCNPTCTCR